MNNEPKLPWRPTKLTPEVQDRICKAIRTAGYPEVSAAHAGIHRTTLYDWLKRGREAIVAHADEAEPDYGDDAIYVEFSEEYDRSLADAEMRDVGLTALAATKDWRAAAWRLERRFPDRWRERKESQHSGVIGVMPVQTLAEVEAELAGLDAPELSAWERAYGLPAAPAELPAADNEV